MSSHEGRSKRDPSAGEDLRSVVERTRGLQPWRRVFHAVNGLALAAVLGPLGVAHPTGAAALAVILGLLLAVDAVRLARPRANVAFFRRFRWLASPRDERRPASSTWYVAGVLLALLVFPPEAALVGVLVLALADPAANLVGRLWGRVAFGDGTVSGTATFVLVGSLAALPVTTPGLALGAATAAALVERIPWPLDDNLTIPLAAGAAAWALGGV